MGRAWIPRIARRPHTPGAAAVIDLAVEALLERRRCVAAACEGQERVSAVRGVIMPAPILPNAPIFMIPSGRRGALEPERVVRSHPGRLYATVTDPKSAATPMSMRVAK